MSTEIDVAALSGRIVRPRPECPVRITIVIEQGRHVETLEIPDPDPNGVQVEINQEEDEPRWFSSVVPAGPIRTSVSVSAVAGEGGVIHTEGRRHVAEVLRRIAGEA